MNFIAAQREAGVLTVQVNPPPAPPVNAPIPAYTTLHQQILDIFNPPVVLGGVPLPLLNERAVGSLRAYYLSQNE